MQLLVNREAHLHYIVATVFVEVLLQRISQKSKIVVWTQSLMCEVDLRAIL